MEKKQSKKSITMKDLINLMKPVMKPEGKLLLLLAQETKQTGMIEKEEFVDLAIEELEEDYSTEESLKNSITRWLEKFASKGFIEMDGKTIKVKDIPAVLRVIESGKVVSMNMLIAGLAIWCLIFFISLLSFDWKLILLSAIGLLLTAITYFTYQKKYVLPR